MAILTQTYNLSMVPGFGAPTCVRLSAGDTNRAIAFNLFDQNGAWTVPDGQRVALTGVGPNDRAFSIVGYANGSKVTFTTSTNAFETPGSYSARVSVSTSTAGTTIIYSDTFEIFVSSGSSILTRNYASVS